jgi:pimeloyl-ACP methyl ester carboxylesterase
VAKLELLHARPQPAPQPGLAPILFVHGSYCGAWIWAEQFMPYFARHGYVCHAVSLRGHGGSEGIYDHASLDDYVTDVRAALAHIGGRAIVVGHSMGGLVVQHCLALEPGIEAAILMSSVPPSGVGSSALYMSMYSPDVLIQFGLLQSLGPAAVKGDIIRRALFSDQTSAKDVAHMMPRFQKESHTICVELLNPARPRLPRRQDAPPILVIGGDDDTLLPSSAFIETATYFDADLKILKGAPHGLMVDSAWWQPTADTVLDWLRDLPPKA